MKAEKSSLLIEICNLGKAYRLSASWRWIFRGIDWSIRYGERWGLMGLNGQGKSTLLRIIGGIETFNEGDVVCHGRVSWPLAFGGAFQGGLTGADNIRFIARLYGVDPEDSVRKVEEFAELGRMMYEPFMTYSSGMRARLAFGASLLIDFDCLLIDEITSVGDAIFGKKCERAFADMSQKTSLIMISHSFETIRAYCNRFALLKGGSLYFFDSADSCHRAMIGA